MKKNEPLISVTSLTKQFKDSPKPALNAISATIFKGTITGLVGPDGAGKTTLLRLINGLLRSTGGTIHVQGFNPAQEANRIHQITGYMPQKFGLYQDLTVRENLNLHAALRSISLEERVSTFDRLLAFTGLEPFQDRLAGQLSGGMKQKLGLACALLGEPKVLLLDEPSVGIDPLSRRELWVMVEALREKGIGIIWSTAYLDEAEKCDHIILLNEGNKLYEGVPKELLKTVQERTFHLVGVAEKQRRHVLTHCLQSGEVTDGVIQGKTIRLVLKDPQSRPSLALLKEDYAIQWQKVAPRLEDGFIDLLGGTSGKPSVLAEHFQPKRIDDPYPIIETKGLVKKFGNFTAVKDGTFSIRRGEIFGLLGPNGAGKSTLFKMLCGLLPPTEGVAVVGGVDIRSAPSQARNKVGYMAQEFSLYGRLSVRQNLRFFSGLYGLSQGHQQEKIHMMEAVLGLEKYHNWNAAEIPPGFMRRLALACAIMHEPDVLFLDEPTSGVDPLTRREFWRHINGLVDKGVTILVTTHFMDEAEYCDRLALIYRGEAIAKGTPDQLKDLVKSNQSPNPTLEETFLTLIERQNKERRPLA